MSNEQNLFAIARLALDEGHLKKMGNFSSEFLIFDCGTICPKKSQIEQIVI